MWTKERGSQFHTMAFFTRQMSMTDIWMAIWILDLNSIFLLIHMKDRLQKTFIHQMSPSIRVLLLFQISLGSDFVYWQYCFLYRVRNWPQFTWVGRNYTNEKIFRNYFFDFGEKIKKNYFFTSKSRKNIFFQNYFFKKSK